MAAANRSNLADPQMTLACYDVYNSVVRHVLVMHVVFVIILTPKTCLTWLIDTRQGGREKQHALPISFVVCSAMLRVGLPHMRHGDLRRIVIL